MYHLEDSMPKIRAGRCVGLVVVCLAAILCAHLLNRAARAADGTTPVKMTKAEDHQRTMDLLHITQLRRGKAGRDKTDPNFANYDESKANPYPNLPAPLTLKNGKKVTTAADWWNKRRPEIVEDFDREVYGRVPRNVPKVTWSVKDSSTGKSG